jgi:hypothetical protein
MRALLVQSADARLSSVQTWDIAAAADASAAADLRPRQIVQIAPAGDPVLPAGVPCGV